MASSYLYDIFSNKKKKTAVSSCQSLSAYSEGYVKGQHFEMVSGVLEYSGLKGEYDMNGTSLGKVKKHVASKDEIEAMLASEFGKKLEPVREKLKVAHKDINTFTEASKRVAQKLKAVLQPEHLRADRLRELVQAGKRRSEIATMYHFKNLKCFDERVTELGCSDLFVKHRSRTTKYA